MCKPIRVAPRAMIRPRPVTVRTVVTAAAMSIATSARAGGWSDNFNDGNAEDGNPVTWTFNETGFTPGIYDASSGDYALSNPGGGIRDLLCASVAVTFTDAHIRTQGVVLPASTGPDGRLGLVGRWDVNTLSGYVLYIDDGGTLGLRRTDLGSPFDLAPPTNLGSLNAASDVMLELNIVGSLLSGYAWRPGDPKPATPQITAIDTTYTAGRAGIAFVEDRDNTVGLFRFASAQDTPIGVSQWRFNADGNWSLANNWIGGVPNGADAVASFGAPITAARTVTMDSPHTVGTINFDNANRYTIAGPAALTIAGGGAVNVINGSHTISTPLALNGNTSIAVSGGNTLTVTAQTIAAAGVTLTKTGSGTVAVKNVRTQGLSVNQGTVAVTANGGTDGTSVVKSLTVAAGAAMDLRDNDLVVDYTGASPQPTLRGYLASGHAGGAWTGGGITSGAAAADPTRALGFAEAADLFTAFPATFGGQTVDDTSVLIAFTRYGDANLDGTVNLQDFNRLAANFGASGSALWTQGDFNYDGSVNLTDFNLLAANFGLSAAGPHVTPEDWAALGAAVPEPGVANVVLLGAGAALRRRRRR